VPTAWYQFLNYAFQKFTALNISVSHKRTRGVDIIHVSLVHTFNTSFLPLLEQGLDLPTESSSCIVVVIHAKPGSICKRVQHLIGVP